MKLKTLLCLALVLSGFFVSCISVMAGVPPIAVSVVIPTENGERRVEYHDHTTHFHVIVSNTSDKPQRVWQEWNSWGYFGLTFEFTDEQGKTWMARKKPSVWTRNFASFWTLDPHESFVIDIYFGDTNIWEGFPLPENGSQTVTMRAVLEFKPDDEARQFDVWTGRAVSKAEKVTFYHWKPDAK
jgi:hypothetical protein